MLGLMQNFPLTVSMILRRMHSQYPNKTVTTLRRDIYHQATYAQTVARANRLAGAIKLAGFRQGDCVSTLMWNSQEHLEAYLAVPAMGGILHTINARLSEAAIQVMLGETLPRLILVDETLAPVLRKTTLPASVQAVVVAGLHKDAQQLDPAVEGIPWLDYETFMASGGPEFNWPELDENEACGICYTSGTTGKMKGVVYSHRSTVLHAMSMLFADGIALSEHDTCMTVVPMYHAHGWGFPYASCLAGAGQAFSVRQSDPKTLAALIEYAGVTLATAVPTVWINLLEKLRSGEIKPDTLASLKSLPVGGAAVSADLLNGLLEYGIKVQHCWGMTETSPLGLVSTRRSWLNDTQWAEMSMRQGLPQIGCEVRVITDKGTLAPEDGKSTGELQIRGPWIADAYFDPDSESRRSGENCFDVDSQGRRWLKTGDIANISPDGYVKIVDRSKDLIKSGGEWISSLDLESAMAEHPAVHEVAVIGIPDPVWQERPLAFVSLVDNWDQPQPDFAAFLEARFPRWQIPERFVILKELPKGATGKLNKARLRQITNSA
jgi:fatty-acyl-CoA synthase